MPNILLTNYCNRRCSYCFAREQVELGTSDPQWEMSDSEFESVLSYLRPGQDPVALLGGEPTLHSKFHEIVQTAVDRGYDIKLFTNGTRPELKGLLDDIPARRLNVLLNLNPPSTYTAEELREIEANCRAYGEQLRLSLNIHKTNFEWRYIRDAIQNWGCGRFVRLGITQPIVGASNTFIKDEDIRRICEEIVAMVIELAEDGISTGFDCGFKQCMFTDRELGILAECGTQFLFVCKPIMDIGPDLMVWRCFPFSTQPAVKLTDFDNMHDIEKHFVDQWESLRLTSDESGCGECNSFAIDSCSGGCLSRSLLRCNQSKC